MKRRDFLSRSALVGVSGKFLSGGAPAIARASEESPNSKVRFACIGVGGKGTSDTDDAGKYGEIAALCDIDEKTLERMGAKYPNAKRYIDYRTMLEEMGDKIDAVTVSTPDHSHAPAAVMAMRMGKHAFVQKPLTWSIEEARLLRNLAAEKKLCTQMGNQGTAESGLREGAELLRHGAIGRIKEIHVWTNRPVWPQGIAGFKDYPGIPNHVHWYEFLGPAHDRAYHAGYHPFNWRGWLDFGTGALGDMACHTINVAAKGLDLFDPIGAEVVDTSGIVDNQTYPTWSIIKTHFGEREGRAPLSLTWYDGGNNLPKEKRAYRELLHGEDPSGSGLLIVGDKGSFFSKNDYGAEYTLLPKDKFGPDYKKPEVQFEKSPGHFKEFVEAIQAGDPKKAHSNFDYAGRLTETVLLGVVALKVGSRIEWDAEAMKVKGNADADQYIRRDYRKGFSIHA
ncbi:Gfo/Idh/MocA family protein [Paludisphaera soli]|uniref:Gfo/Idh/MocA family protein n=1 Tax=Paludisphaera soli TaxID=2712865 RepID=UPI0013EBE195|nr:Gfo/Idh/MocA family oxidoreductase [Paludisphaera soli]